MRFDSALTRLCFFFFFFFQAEDGIRDLIVTGVQTCALPISGSSLPRVQCADLVAQHYALSECASATQRDSEAVLPGEFTALGDRAHQHKAEIGRASCRERV